MLVLLLPFSSFVEAPKGSKRTRNRTAAKSTHEPIELRPRQDPATHLRAVPPIDLSVNVVEGFFQEILELGTSRGPGWHAG